MGSTRLEEGNNRNPIGVRSISIVQVCTLVGTPMVVLGYKFRFFVPRYILATYRRDIATIVSSSHRTCDSQQCR